MPAQGRGANLKPSQVRSKPAPKPSAPLVYAPHRAPAPVRHVSSPVFSRSLPQKPFAGAQKQAARNVQKARQTKAPPVHAIIPRLQNPTPAQVHAALNLTREVARRALGPNPSAARIREYQNEVATDPRLAEFRATVKHYVNAAEGHLAAVTGRGAARTGVVPSPGPLGNIESRLTDFLSRFAGPPGKPQTPVEAQVALGRQILAEGVGRSQAGPGKEPGGIHIPFANIKIPTGKIAAAVEAEIPKLAPGLASATPETKFFKNALGDVRAVGELPFVGSLQVGKAGLAAAQGNLTPTEQLASAVFQGLKHGAAGELLQGHLQGAGEAFKAHPIFSLLEALGESGVAGRTAGALTRAAGADVEAAGVRGALARVGSTVRSPIALNEDAGAAAAGRSVLERNYSKDLIRKAIQVANDKRRTPITDAEGNIVHTVSRGQRVPVLAAKNARELERLQHYRANFSAASANAGNRGARERARRLDLEGRTKPGRLPLALRAELRPQVGNRAHPIKLAGKLTPVAIHEVAEHMATLVADGTIKTGKHYEQDLTDRITEIRDSLENHREDYNGPELKEAEENLALLEAGLRPEIKRKALQIARVGISHGKELTKLDVALGEHHIYPAEQLHSTRLGVYAINHVEGAQYAGDEALAKELAKAQAVRRAAEESGSERDLAKARVYEALVQQRFDKTVQLRRPVDVEGAGGVAVKQELRPLTRGEIEAHARANGRDPNTIGYLPHRRNVEDARSYYQHFRPGSRPVGKEHARTFALYKRGVNVVHRDLVRDELTAKSTSIARTIATDKDIQDNGLRHPAWGKAKRGAALTKAEERVVEKGGWWTGKEADEKIRQLKDEGKGNFVALRAFGARLPAEAKQSLGENLDVSPLESLGKDLLKDRAVDPTDDTTRNVALYPEAQFNQLLRHLTPPGELERRAQLLNVPFRLAVLPQPRWLAGNFLEPFFIRLPLYGSGANIPGLLMDLHAGHKILKSMERGTAEEKQAAQEIRDTMFQGLFIGRKGASVHRTYEDFHGITHDVLKGGHKLFQLPVFKQMKDLFLLIPHTFFHGNRILESGLQRAAFGNIARKEIQAITGSWTETIRVGEAAMADVRKGLLNTATQHRFLDKMHEMLGQYEGFNPTTRKAIQTVFPFLPWTLASLRFVYWTLPAHHTVAFTALVKAAQSVQDEWEAEHKDLPPGDLKAGIVRKDQGIVNVARYTPFGLTYPLSQLGEGKDKPGEALEGITGTFLPQLSSFQNALAGQSPFNSELQFSGGKEPSGGEYIKAALNALFESFVPGLAIGRRLKEGGGTPYADSTFFDTKVKPGSKHQSAVSRTLSPFAPTYLKSPTGSEGADSVESQIIREAERESEGADDPVEAQIIKEAEEEEKRK